MSRQDRRRHRLVGLRTDRGGVPIELAMGVGVLILPVALIALVLPTWFERQSMARVAAAEAARAVVTATSCPDGAAAARALVSRTAANHGLAAGEVAAPRVEGCTAGPTGGVSRHAVVTVAVTVRIPATPIPFVGRAGGFSWTARATEHADRYRSAPP